MLINATGIDSFKIPEPLAGQFGVEVINAEMRKTGKGIDQLFLDMVIIDGPQDSEGGETKGRGLNDFIMTDLTTYKQSKGYEFMKIKLLGCCASFGVDISTENADSDNFIGKKAVAIVTVQTDQNGMPQSRISGFKPYEGEAGGGSFV